MLRNLASAIGSASAARGAGDWLGCGDGGSAMAA